MRIGIDFDNTIVSYEGVFHQAALEKGLIPKEVPLHKGAVRDYLRRAGNEASWTELQGYIYGARMDLASPYPGIDSFLSLCRAHQISIAIISHKTLHPFLGPKYDLHLAAKKWLTQHSFAWVPSFFELTLQAKLERISQEKCTIFIDDLPELLAEKEFPSGVQKILFDPTHSHPKSESYTHAGSWDEIAKMIEHGT